MDLLGHDHEIFDRLDHRRRQLALVRVAVAAPFALIGAFAPIFYVLFWPVVTYSWLVVIDYNIEWVFWHLGALAMGAVWGSIGLLIHRRLVRAEEFLDQALDALDAKAYDDPVLLQATIANPLTSLRPLSQDEVESMRIRFFDLEKTKTIWQQWENQDAPIRLCDADALDEWLAYPIRDFNQLPSSIHSKKHGLSKQKKMFWFGASSSKSSIAPHPQPFVILSPDPLVGGENPISGGQITPKNSAPPENHSIPPSAQNPHDR